MDILMAAYNGDQDGGATTAATGGDIKQCDSAASKYVGEEEFPPNKKQKCVSSLTPVSEVQPLQHQLQSHDLPRIEGIQPLEQTPVSDVQPLQPELQSQQELERASSQQGLTKLADDINVTPATAKPVSKSGKKYKKKNSNDVWTRPTSRKGKKKNKGNQSNGSHANGASVEERVLISPVMRFPDKNDDSVESSICLSKFYKADKVEISEDRLSAGSTKGYRMVRATRGVVEGAWYFEIEVVHLGETGHTRLGWTTDKGDLQAPVGFDANSFGYRDVDGSKVHKALREDYGEGGYGEGDVLGFYINLPDGGSFVPKPPRYVWFKGQRYVSAPDATEDPPKVVPGSEICFFKNGNCQGTAFSDLFGGRYFPAASMYTLPNQSNCLVKFNFGPNFVSFPADFGGRPVPRPMIEVPYHGCDGRIENGVSE